MPRVGGYLREADLRMPGPTHQSVILDPTPRVVVLGGTGFVGSNIVSCLKDAGLETVTTSSADVDLRYPESVSTLDSVICDGDVLVFASALTPDKGRSIRSMMDNIAMAANACATPSIARCSHLIYLSSRCGLWKLTVTCV